MVGLSIILLVLSGIAKAFMDLSSENNLPFKNDYFNKSKSWSYKWSHTTYYTPKLSPKLSEKGDNWWYFGIIKPKYKERFPFSSTILVGFTDFWHLAQKFFLTFLILGVYLFDPLYIPLVDLIIISCSFLIPFELVHSWIKNYTYNKKRLKNK